MTEPLIVDRDGYVETWTLNNPEERNPVSADEVIDAISDAVARVNNDLDVRAVIVTGAGSAFSSGGNVKDMAAGRGLFGGAPYEQSNKYRRGIQRNPRALYDCEVPLIAAVNGAAVGAGCDLALMCDLRIASTSAFFAESFVQLGIIPGDGGAWFLSRILDPGRAAEMTLTGDRVDAATALEWGLVSKVVAPEELLTAAHALAARITKNPPHATRLAKKLLREAPLQQLPSFLELSAALQAISHHTEDHKEAVAAFLEKRPGVFRGR